MSHVERAIELNPRSGSAHVAKAGLLMRQKRTEEAIELLQQAVEAMPADPALRVGLADVYLATQEAGKAREQLEQALAAAPDRIEPRLALSRMDVAEGNAEAAVAHLRAVLADHPEQFAARALLGELLLAQGKRDEAQAELERVVQVQPSYGTAYHLLAMVLQARGERDQAIRYARSAIQAGLRDSRVDVLLARLYWSNGQYGLVDQALSDGLRRNPRSRDLLNSLAWLRATCPDSLYRNGAEAERIVTPLAEAMPDNPQVLDTLAAAQAETGDFQAAVKTQQKVIELLKAAGVDPAPAEYLARLANYQAGRPFRDTLGETPGE
jgi:tetratricopeptide (TPR) repeat protein